VYSPRQKHANKVLLISVDVLFREVVESIGHFGKETDVLKVQNSIPLDAIVFDLFLQNSVFLKEHNIVGGFGVMLIEMMSEMVEKQLMYGMITIHEFMQIFV
jgi:hypothetical protein